MLGAIVGDVVGSPFEFDNDRKTAHSKKFPLVSERSYATDDTVLTLAVARGIMKAIPVRGQAVSDENFEKGIAESMRLLGNKYPHAGY